MPSSVEAAAGVMTGIPEARNWPMASKLGMSRSVLLILASRRAVNADSGVVGRESRALRKKCGSGDGRVLFTIG